MHPLLLVVIPLALIILGMILNSIGLSFDQPPSSPEQDPVKRLAAERDTFRQFFDRAVPRNLAQVSAENLIGLTKQIRRGRKLLGEITSHPDALRALAGK